MTINQENYFSSENSKKWEALNKKKVLIINTQWNTEIITSMTNKASELLKFANVNHDVLMVPGSYEIPFVANKKAKDYDGIITIGCVIKGDTYHFEAISNYVSMKIGDVSIKTNTPITFGVLTTNSLAQAQARSKDNNFNKGLEAAAALLDMMLI